MTAPQPICACRLDRSHKERSICEIGPDAPSAKELLPKKQLTRQSPRNSRGAAGWVLPSIGLVLVPKCPMCIAAWLALGGGLGVSFATASYLRTGFIWLCWGVLAVVAVRLALGFKLRPRNMTAPHPN
jgi:hypothetical protein